LWDGKEGQTLKDHMYQYDKALGALDDKNNGKNSGLYKTDDLSGERIRGLYLTIKN